MEMNVNNFLTDVIQLSKFHSACHEPY